MNERRCDILKVILYTTHCPKCEILEKKLNERNISFEKITDVNLMLEKGFTNVPMLSVDDTIMDFNEANKWISEQN